MDTELELWKQAGKIAGEAREFGKELLKEGSKLVDVERKIEEFILKKKAKLAFPCQISLNGLAAHFAPDLNDETILKPGDIAKLDLGAQVDGYAGDTAVTIEVKTNSNSDLIKASREALNEAIKLCKPGVKVCEIGEVVNQTITSFGFKPIKNLSGHKIDRYILHSYISIPNFNNEDKRELKEGTIIAIEPFATTGAGLVKEGKPSNVFRLLKAKPVRDPISREILEFIKKEYNTLPFARRHLAEKFQPSKVNFALMNLEKHGILYHYPQLPEIEEKTCLVSQHEHSIYISDPPIVLTK